jgi:hypothetical protein
MALSRVHYSPGFPPGAGFFGEQSHHSRPREENPVLAEQTFQRGSRTPPEHSSLDSELRWKRRSGEELLQSSRSTLKQIPLREILLLKEILG